MTPMGNVLMIVVIVTAALMSALAWRYASDARRRQVARAALLRQVAISEVWDDRRHHEDELNRAERDPAPAVDLMFASGARPPAAPAHRKIAAATVAIVVALVAATVFAGRGPAPSGVSQQSEDATVAAVPAAHGPVVLTLLSYARDRAGTLTVSGSVQNPPGAASLDHLVVVIDAVDASDRAITTVTSDIEAVVLAGGDASRFVVAIPRSNDVARCRVRFRLRDGTAIAHRDARPRTALGS
jgi:hypothetical protein